MIRKLFVFFFLLSPFAYAAKDAKVVTEGAIVYKGNSFDAPILGYFSAGKKIRISDKVYGAFYRVAFKQGVIGYISDIDVKVAGQKPINQIFRRDDKSDIQQNRPYLGDTYWGMHLGSVAFTDTIGTFSGSSNVTMIGANFTMPVSFFDGAFTLAFNTLYSLETPSFYNSISQNDPTGFVLLSDAQLLYGWFTMMERRLSFYFGAGLLLTYSDVTVVQDVDGLKEIPLASASLGGSFVFGLSYQLTESMVLKFEPKYYFEEDAYFGLTSSLMFQL